MLANLLRSLIFGDDAESAILPNLKPLRDDAEPSDEDPVLNEAEPDIFEFDELDLNFNGEEEAEYYHRDIERNNYVAAFDAVEGRVTSLGDEDGADFDLDDLGNARFGINAADIVGPLPQTAELAEAATFRSFLDVRAGRKSSIRAATPCTRYHAIAEGTLLHWADNIIVRGACSEEDVDTLIGSIRGRFDAKVVRSNLVHELINFGLMDADGEGRENAFVVGKAPDPEDIIDLLASICNGSNMRPGVEFRPLSAQKEVQLFKELAASRRDICRTLVSNAMLVSIVIMLGKSIDEGTVNQSLLTDLDIQKSRQTPDSELLSAALSYLVEYQTRLEEGDTSPEDRAHALEAASAMKLSRAAIELIAQGLQANTKLDDARQQIEASLAVREKCRQEILLEHMSLVRRQAFRREAYVDDVEDLVHDGVFGLMRSIDLFEPDRGHRFMTYCQFGVRQSISRALDDAGSLVRVPSHRAVVLRKVDELEGAIAERLPAEVVIALISEEMDLSADDIRLIRRIPRKSVPYEELEPDCLDVDSPQFRNYLALQRTEFIEDFVSEMPERAADIIVRRFGLRNEDEMTLEELGEIYGVTRERIRQIEAKRLAEMGHPTHKRLLRNLL